MISKSRKKNDLQAGNFMYHIKEYRVRANRTQQLVTFFSSIHYYIVNSMIALTMSLALFLSALTALERETLAWDITSSMSLASTPDSSTSPSSSSSSGMAAWPVVPVPPISDGAAASAALNFWAASI